MHALVQLLGQDQLAAAQQKDECGGGLPTETHIVT